MSDVPELQTPRLILRGHRLGDFERLVTMWSDLQVVTHFGGKPFSREDSWNRLLRYAGHWRLLGHGLWAVTLRDDDVHIGDVGFLHGERTGVPAFGCPEAAWSFHPHAQGRGLASEAVGAALAWGDRHFDRTVAMINPANTASIRVAQRHGYTLYGDAEYREHPVGLWVRFRSASAR